MEDAQNAVGVLDCFGTDKLILQGGSCWQNDLCGGNWEKTSGGGRTRLFCIQPKCWVWIILREEEYAMEKNGGWRKRCGWVLPSINLLYKCRRKITKFRVSGDLYLSWLENEVGEKSGGYEYQKGLIFQGNKIVWGWWEDFEWHPLGGGALLIHRRQHSQGSAIPRRKKNGSAGDKNVERKEN